LAKQILLNNEKNLSGNFLSIKKTPDKQAFYNFLIFYVAFRKASGGERGSAMTQNSLNLNTFNNNKYINKYNTFRYFN